MKDFNIAKYLRENHLGSHAILGRYVDLHALKEEEDYGNNKPVDEVPYVGTDKKLDGFGDEFDQVEPVSEAEGEENPWIEDVDGSSAYKVGRWTCSYEYPGYLDWSYAGTKIFVAATPGYDGSNGTPIQLVSNGEIVAVGKLNQLVFDNFTDYAEAIKPYLDQVEQNYNYPGDLELESLFGDLWKDPSTEIDEEVTVSSSGVEMEEAMDDEDDSSDHFNKSVIAANMERIYDSFELQIQRLISKIVDAGFDPEDAAQFLRDYADHLDKQNNTDLYPGNMGDEMSAPTSI